MQEHGAHGRQRCDARRADAGRGQFVLPGVRGRWPVGSCPEAVFESRKGGGEPRRYRCTVCLVTHVLLPARMLLRRMDEGLVIGAALKRRPGARGAAGSRRTGGPGGRYEGGCAGPREGRSGPGGVHPGGGGRQRGPGAAGADGSPLADALVAVAAAAVALAGWWPRLLAVAPWEIASAVTNATLLAPVMAAAGFNASPSREAGPVAATLDPPVSAGIGEGAGSDNSAGNRRAAAAGTGAGDRAVPVLADPGRDQLAPDRRAKGLPGA